MTDATNETTATATEEPTGSATPMHVVYEPEVYLIGSQVLDDGEVQRFLDDHGSVWETDAKPGEALAEAGGRLCYMSYGKGRKTIDEYLGHIITLRHGSVLEHACWNFVFTNVSRSLTHELIRHRAGFGYSQRSQRYVDESECPFIQPDCIAEDSELDQLWRETIQTCRETYDTLVDRLTESFADTIEAPTMRRKMARQAARSVLPNATETKIFVTANARALRHFCELRGSEHADVEIRKLAVKVLRVLHEQAPAIFGDMTIEALPDGAEVVVSPNSKV